MKKLFLLLFFIGVFLLLGANFSKTTYAAVAPGCTSQCSAGSIQACSVSPYEITCASNGNHDCVTQAICTGTAYCWFGTCPAPTPTSAPQCTSNSQCTGYSCSGCFKVNDVCSSGKCVNGSGGGTASSLCNSACSGTQVCAGCMLTNTTCNASGTCVANSAAGQTASSLCNSNCTGTWCNSATNTVCGQTCNSSGSCVNNSATCTSTSCGGAPPPVCGDGTCNGTETCSTCSTDCGACPVTPVCGDGSCNGSETCSTCSTDCGTCPVTTYSITGNVFIDTNANGSKDTGEANYTGATVTLSTGATTTSNTSGNYTFSSLAAGSYTVTITTPSGYVATTTNPAPKTLGPSTTANFGMQQVPTYTVSGSVFVDDNKNQVQDGAEANYSGGITISSVNTTTGQNAGNITYPNPKTSGTYLISGLAAGTYTISYSLPSGYQLSYPLNGPPPSFNITVGPGCSVGGSNSASCN